MAKEQCLALTIKPHMSSEMRYVGYKGPVPLYKWLNGSVCLFPIESVYLLDINSFQNREYIYIYIL